MKKDKISHYLSRTLKGAGLFLGTVFVLFSVLPYLISLEEAAVTREELVYSNSEFIKIEGLELHYREWARINGKENNVLMVHGLGGSTFAWRYTAPMLQEEGFRVIAVDLPGFGLSERKTGLDHSPEARAELLWSLLEELDPNQKWNLVGHSMGGAAVTAMALQNPGQTGSVTLAAGALIPFEPSVYSLLLKYPPVGRWARVIGSRYFITESRIEELLASAYGQKPSEHELKGYYLPLKIKNTDAVWPDLLRTVSEPLIGRLYKLRVPVLCIWGEDDTWVPVEQGRYIDRRLPNSTLVVIPGAGHCPMETAPDIFDQKITEFLKGLN